jgi:hypothetical protein
MSSKTLDVVLPATAARPQLNDLPTDQIALLPWHIQPAIDHDACNYLATSRQHRSYLRGVYSELFLLDDSVNESAEIEQPPSSRQCEIVDVASVSKSLLLG